MQATPWLLRQSGKTRRERIYCFCYAGGSAVRFLPWQDFLGTDIEVCAVQLPGRGARFPESPYAELAPLIRDLAGVIAAQDTLPFTFFGHSLGGILAFELARHFRRNGLSMPQKLIVSGSSAPQHRDPKNFHKLPDGELIEALKDYNGTPPEILAHRELMELLLPTIRSDLALAENYQYVPEPLLDLPITVLAGRLDPHVSAEQAEGWQKETTGEFRIHWFEGDHFFLNSEEQALLHRLRSELS